MNGIGTDGVLRIRVLGSFSVSLGGQSLDESVWQRRHAQQLVKLLAISPRHRLHRDVLLESLWPESSPEKASNNLNKVLYMARRALEPKLKSGAQSRYLRRSAEIIELVVDDGLQIDVDQFEELAQRALKQADYASVNSCVELYTGDLLEDEVFDEQFAHRRETLTRLYHQLLVNLSDLATLNNQFNVAIESLSELLRADPLNEDYHRRLIILYRDQGQRSKALDQYERCEKILAKELNQSPDPDTQALSKTLIAKHKFRSDQNNSNSDEQLIDNAYHNKQVELLAVLPLENTGESEEFEYLSDAITEDLICSLSRIQGQRVLARSTVFRYKNRAAEPALLRAELGVNRVIAGRIANHQGRIRIWIELVDTNDGVLLWAQHYDREMKSFQHLQNDISDDLLAYFQSTSGITKPSVVHKLQARDPDSYHLYLKGRYHWNKRTGKSLETAINYFRTALDHDPVYAQAWSGLADTYSLMSLLTSAPPHETMPKACAAATRALEIDPNCCEAHTSLAYYQLSYDWQWVDAEKSFERALQLNPHYATARQWFHKLLVARGRFDEARTQIALAKQHDPLSLMINAEEGWGLYHSGRYADAIKHLEQVLADDPQFAMAHYILGLVYSQVSQYDLAIENFHAAAIQQQNSSPFALQAGALGYAYARVGQHVEARRHLQKLQQMDYAAGSVAYASAMIYVGLNDNLAALSCLERAFESRLDRLIFLQVEPIFNSLHSLHLFAQMCKQLGQPSKKE